MVWRQKSSLARDGVELAQVQTSPPRNGVELAPERPRAPFESQIPPSGTQNALGHPEHPRT